MGLLAVPLLHRAVLRLPGVRSALQMLQDSTLLQQVRGLLLRWLNGSVHWSTRLLALHLLHPALLCMPSVRTVLHMLQDRTLLQLVRGLLLRWLYGSVHWSTGLLALPLLHGALLRLPGVRSMLQDRTLLQHLLLLQRQLRHGEQGCLA